MLYVWLDPDQKNAKYMYMYLYFHAIQILL